MNQNRPFYSTNTNLYDEFFRTSAPTTINGENVILSQEQLRRVCDTLNTSVVGNPYGISGNRQVMCAQKQFFPGGVLFSFPQTQVVPQNISQGPYCKCPPLPVSNIAPENFNYFHQSPAAVNTFYPSSMEFQQVKNPGGVCYQQPLPRESFQLKFHLDRGTSCSDLLNAFSQVSASKSGFPDLSNLNGVLRQQQNNLKFWQGSQGLFFPSPPIEFSSNAKKLVLSKSMSRPTGHVIDILNESASNESNKKKVSFSDPGNPVTGDKSSQITSDCIYDEKKCKNKSKTTKKQRNKQDKEKKKNKSDSNTPSETSVSADCEDDGNGYQGPRKKRRWSRQKKNDSEHSSDSQMSESESGMSSEKPKRNKRKKRQKQKDIKVNSESESQTDASNPAEFSSDKAHNE